MVILARSGVINSNKAAFERASRIKEELEWLKKRFDASDEELLRILNPGEYVPLRAFSKGLGVIESLVLYLSETKTLNDIAEALGRKYSTIANTLRKAKAKPHQEEIPSDILVPLEVFTSELAPLQSLVKYLREEKGLTYGQIGKLLRRDSKNIGNTYREVVK